MTRENGAGFFDWDQIGSGSEGSCCCVRGRESVVLEGFGMRTALLSVWV